MLRAHTESMHNGEAMANIRVGTTPNIIFTFKSVSVQNITTAIMTVRKDGEEVLRKTLDDATVDEKKLTWRLTQEDTIAIGDGNASCMLNWVTSDGTRGASDELTLMFDSNHIKEVI